MNIRQATAKDVPEIRDLVMRVVGEVYGHLLPDGVPVPEDPWDRSLVAVGQGRILGVVLTLENRIEDLWIDTTARRKGLGTALLSAAENRIRNCGHAQGRLRFIAENRPARDFYEACGWSRARAYPHEGLKAQVIEMTKDLDA